MAGTLFWIDAIQVFIGAEDHPPPHVHAVHSGEGWVARFRFSFLSDGGPVPVSAQGKEANDGNAGSGGRGD